MNLRPATSVSPDTLPAHLTRSGLAATTMMPPKAARFGYDLGPVVAGLDLLDPAASVAELEGHRVPVTRAAQRAGYRRSHQVFIELANEALFIARAELRRASESPQTPALGASSAGRALIDLENVTELIFRLNHQTTTSYVRSLTADTLVPEQDMGDVQAAAELGLAAAIASFDSAKGWFEPWAHWKIVGEVQAAVHSAERQSLTLHDHSVRHRVRLATQRLIKSGGDLSTASPQMIGDVAGVNADKVRRVQAAAPVASLQDAPHTHVDDRTYDPFDRLDETESARRDLHRLLDAASLDAREHYVIVRLFGLDGEAPSSLAELGGQLRLTRESMRQTRVRAFGKMHMAMRDRPARLRSGNQESCAAS